MFVLAGLYLIKKSERESLLAANTWSHLKGTVQLNRLFCM